ncbi:hypothetical protein M2387_000977 [Klebsiella sp. BIGb0407]|nr:hypothetical protein [Klebsiella sp. BIGb0407]
MAIGGALAGFDKVINVDVPSAFAGGAGIAKGGGKLVEKASIFVEKRLKSSVVNKILEANRTGSGLKPDPSLRDSSYLNYEQLMDGKVFTITGGGGIKRKLLQVEGSFNDKKGIFEYIYEKEGSVTHQRFIENGRVTGQPNQKIVKG